MVHFRTCLYPRLFLVEELVRFPFLIDNHYCNIRDCFSTSSLARVIKAIGFLRKYIEISIGFSADGSVPTFFEVQDTFVGSPPRKRKQNTSDERNRGVPSIHTSSILE